MLRVEVLKAKEAVRSTLRAKKVEALEKVRKTEKANR